MAQGILETPLNVGSRIGAETTLTAISPHSLRLGGRLGWILFFALPAIPVVAAIVHFLPLLSRSPSLLALAIVGGLYGLTAACLLVTHLGLSYTFTSKTILIRRLFIFFQRLPADSVREVRVDFADGGGRVDRDLCQLAIVDREGRVYLRISRLNSEHDDLVPFLSVAASIAEILGVAATVTGRPRPRAIEDVARIISERGCFRPFLTGEIEAKEMKPAHPSRRAHLNLMLQDFWERMVRYVITGLTIVNFAVFWCLLVGLVKWLGLSWNLLNFWIALLFLAIGAAFGEYVLVNRLFGWDDARWEGRPWRILTRIWFALLILATGFGFWQWLAG